MTPNEIYQEITNFGYKNAVPEIIENSKELDKNGKVFIECANRILKDFKMTRSGKFKGKNIKKILQICWNEVGDQVFEIHDSVIKSGHNRDRFLLELSETQREALINKIWMMTKQLLPITMGKTSYGLVGASKVLFSVLPEVVLPVDNSQWLHVFKTVDLGDVLRIMVSDIQRWEKATRTKLNEVDRSKQITTLPSVYNVMAMAARPKRY